MRQARYLFQLSHAARFWRRSSLCVLVFRPETAQMTYVERRPEGSASHAGDFASGRTCFVPDIANSTAGCFAGAQTYVF